MEFESSPLGLICVSPRALFLLEWLCASSPDEYVHSNIWNHENMWHPSCSFCCALTRCFFYSRAFLENFAFVVEIRILQQTNSAAQRFGRFLSVSVGFCRFLQFTWNLVVGFCPFFFCVWFEVQQPQLYFRTCLLLLLRWRSHHISCKLCHKHCYQGMLVTNSYLPLQCSKHLRFETQ